MTSISFDNPYLLLIAIPLLLLVAVPYFIAIRKENKSKSTVATLILHTVIIAIVSLALAGVHMTTVKTETEVFVVADISYSTDRDLEKIDGYIENLFKEENLPENTKVGVVCFGKEHKINTELGGQFVSVTETELDDSATDISGALEYTSTLFSNDAVKRIVLVTDGAQNTSGETSGLINSIKNMEAKSILVDAIYVDSNLEDGEYEVQITEIDYVKSTYLNTESELEVWIRSNTEYVPNTENPKDKNDSFVRLYGADGELVKEISKPLHKGMNSVTFKLDTSVAKTTDYRVVVEATHDTSLYNNEYTFSQSVAESHKILLVSKLKTDLAKAQELYGDFAQIDAPLIDRKPVPYSLEELCAYDEFIISDFDIKTLDNAGAFIANLNTAVAKFGKTLITAGNIYVQNQTDVVYKTLGNMMAINYGNNEGDPKLYAIVIDSSRSMQDASQLIMAKESAIQLLNLMSPTDYVMVVSFSGDVSIVQPPTALTDKEAVKKVINDIKPTQGTVLGAGLRVAYEQIKGYDDYQKQVVLISDGRSYTSEKDDPLSITKEMYKVGIHTSAINTCSAVGEDILKQIAKIGQGGNEEVGYYFINNPEEVSKKVSTEVADDLHETVIVGDTPVNIEDYSDPLVAGISSLPNIGGYYFGKVESDATVVLTVDYKQSKDITITVPIYSYRTYENGKVVSISTSFSGDWVSAWDTDTNGKAVFTRALTENTPEEKIDYPFNFNVSLEGSTSSIEIIPGEANPDIFVDLEITAPSGDTAAIRLEYDSGSYTMDYEVKEAGKYLVKVDYTYGEQVFPAQLDFDVAYMPEYDRFELFDSAVLYNSISEDGTVSEDGELKIEADEDREETHTVYFTIPLMIAAVVLYVIDIIVRKLKWSDIKSFFKRSKAGGNV